MSWDGTESVPRFYMFGEDLASAYVLRHQTSTVLEFCETDEGLEVWCEVTSLIGVSIIETWFTPVYGTIH